MKNIKRSIEKFLNKNCKPIMRQYYMRRYKKDIVPLLLLLDRYSEAGDLDFMHIMSTLSSYEGWDMERAMRAYAYSSYCGFVESQW